MIKLWHGSRLKKELRNDWQPSEIPLRGEAFL